MMTLPDQEDRANGVRCLIKAGGPQIEGELPLETGAPSSLSSFVAWGIDTLPAEHYALLIMGHGNGLLRGTGTAGFMPRELRRELQAGIRSLGRPLDLVGLDTCFGGSLEVAYELRGTCRYLTAAPGLIFSPGLAWYEALEIGKPEPLELAKRLVAGGMRGEGPLALVGLDLERLDPVVSGLQTLTSILRARPAEAAPTISYVRSKSRSWGDKGELCDLRQLALGLERNCSSSDVQRASIQVSEALADLVVAQWQTPETGGEAVGLGIYCPATLEEVPLDYAQEFELAGVTGWSAYLQEAWSRLAGVLTGGAK